MMEFINSKRYKLLLGKIEKKSKKREVYKIWITYF